MESASPKMRMKQKPPWNHLSAMGWENLDKLELQAGYADMTHKYKTICIKLYIHERSMKAIAKKHDNILTKC